MSKGILLSAFQKRGYPYAAYNAALSIKHFDPEIKIALYHDATLNHLHPSDKEIFDLLIPMAESDKYVDGKFSPAHLKLSLYDILPFDETIILDADVLAIENVSKIFDECKRLGGYYYSHIKEIYHYNGDRNCEGMDWAYMDDIYTFYNLKLSQSFSCSNSSFQYVRKCKESKQLFQTAKECLNNPIPLDRLKHNWGGGQPDELYMNVAMAKMGIDGKMENEIMHQCNILDRRPIHEMAKDIVLLSFLGGKNFCRPYYTEFYDRHLIKISNEQGKSHRYKWNYIVNDKYSGAPRRLTTRQNVLMKQVKSGIIPIDKTILVDQSKLISSYNLVNGNKFRITNYFNCSVAEFNGRKYFAYRMEAKPFCVYMKIGICLLDNDYQPIPETNVLLSLHSDLKGHDKGYHVEDPRLFVANEKLYLSYTDGYQMAQAEIDPETLKALNSFYIDKPEKLRTEKNWTFFEDSGKLKCIYDLPSMTIFEMDGNKYKLESKSDKKIEWKYGEIRGGSSPIKVKDKFISFFHSRTSILVNGASGYQYHMGAIEFEAKEPYNITRISVSPLVSGEEVDSKIPRLSNRIYVVFPCGSVKEKDGFAVSFGYNDYQCRIVKISNELLESTFKKV